MITREEIEKAGWEYTGSMGLTNSYRYEQRISPNLAKHATMTVLNDEFTLSEFGGYVGDKVIYRNVFKGRLSSILELEHIMHWTGIK